MIAFLSAPVVLVVSVVKCITHFYISKNDRPVSLSRLHRSPKSIANSTKLDFCVLNQITKNMPSISFNRTSFEIPKNIILADPEFRKTSTIDALIGVKLFYKLLCVVSLRNHPDAVLQKAHLGWIVAGEINSSSLKNNYQCHIITHSTPLDANLTKFWEMEEVPFTKSLSQENKLVNLILQLIRSVTLKVDMSFGCPLMKRK